MDNNYCCDKMKFCYISERAFKKSRFIEGLDMNREVYYCYTKLVGTPLRLLIFDHCPFCGKKI